MNKKDMLAFGLVLTGLMVSSLPAKADDIDEKEKALQSKITMAASTKQITTKDSAALKKQMAKFALKKKELKAADSDVLTIQDDAQLDKLLNSVSQDLEKRKKH